MTMTTYPLEFYLCLKGTPHIKIVDWNLHDEPRQSLMHEFNYQARQFFKGYEFIAGMHRESLLDHASVKQYDLAVQDSDQHLLLVLQFGEQDWIELSEQEALALIK